MHRDETGRPDEEECRRGSRRKADPATGLDEAHAEGQRDRQRGDVVVAVGRGDAGGERIEAAATGGDRDGTG
jgi:hypothetical protein